LELKQESDMTPLIRRNLLILMIGATSLVLTAAGAAPSFAKDGGKSDSSGSSDNSGSGSDGGDDNSGSGHDDDGDDDNSGQDGSGDSNDDSGDDNSNDDSSRNNSASAADSVRASRPTAIITLTPESLAGVQNGSLVVVDDLGRVLEIELDQVNGAQVIKAKPHGGDAKRNPGPITSVSVVPAAQAPVHG
jgi:hypothetical protein